MSTLFFDQVSLGFALRQLEEEILGPCFWAPATHRQTQFLIWYQNNRDELTSDLSNQAMASLDDHEELNLFLKRRDCGAMFRPFDGVSVASVIDLLVDWPLTADITSISRLESADSQQYVALKLLPDCVQIYDVPGYTNPLAVIETRTGCQLWIMAISQPKDGLELALTAQQIRQAGKNPWKDQGLGLVLPMVYIEPTEVDLTWMIGAHTVSPKRGYQGLIQAFQRYSLTIGEENARAKIVTGLANTRSFGQPTDIVISEPALIFFTQPGLNLALSPAFVDKDNWIPLSAA